MPQLSKLIKSFAFIASVLAISFSLSYLVSAWTEPSVNPPNPDPNISTPLNIGSTGQSKAGGLILNTGGAPNGLIVQSGNVQIGGAMIFNATTPPAVSAPDQVTMYYDPTTKNLNVSVNGQPYVSLTSGATAPSQVTGLSATAGTTQVSLSWSAPANNGGRAITDYKIYRSTSPNSELYLTNVGSAATSFTNTSLDNGATYYYKVSAVNAIGDGNQSAEANATTPFCSKTYTSNTTVVTPFSFTTAYVIRGGGGGGGSGSANGATGGSGGSGGGSSFSNNGNNIASAAGGSGGSGGVGSGSSGGNGAQTSGSYSFISGNTIAIHVGGGGGGGGGANGAECGLGGSGSGGGDGQGGNGGNACSNMGGGGGGGGGTGGAGGLGPYGATTPAGGAGNPGGAIAGGSGGGGSGGAGGSSAGSSGAGDGGGGGGGGAVGSVIFNYTATNCFL